MFEMFGKKKAAPVPAPRRPAGAQQNSPQRAGPSAQAAATAAANDPRADEAGSNRRMIERLPEVPSNQGLLTGARAVMKISREFESSIVAIERGPKRVMILVDPSHPNKDGMKQVLQSLRAKLSAASYTVEPDQPCRSDVIRLLLDNHNATQGVDLGDARVVQSQSKDRFLRWLEVAVREGATDMHVQVTGQGKALVQLRVDGELETLRDERDGIYTELEAMEAMAWPFNIGSTKGSNNNAQWDHQRNLYCMTEPRPVGDKQISLRYQSLRGHAGPKMICRLLNVDVNAKTLSYDDLGYARSQRGLMLEVANMPSGFVLFAGVTGSGKTTTLKTFVETHPGNGAMAIYSMEDPVEYPLRGVHQIVLQRDVSDKQGSMRLYNETVASLMRADPDITIVGEIRDSATAAAGQQIVETGHMALGTVHAHLIPGIIPRLTNEEVGMSRDVLTNPNMLTLLAYQALVPKVCPHCSLGFEAAIAQAREGDALSKGLKEEAHHLEGVQEALRERFRLPTEPFRFKRVGGCDKCGGRGTKGVTVVAELMIPDRTWLELTRAGDDYKAMVHYRQASDKRFDSDDMTGKTIFEHTLFKALRGSVDPRQCERFDSFKRFELAPVLRPTDFK